MPLGRSVPQVETRLWSVRDRETAEQFGIWFALAGGTFSVLMAVAVPGSTGSAAGRVATFGLAAALLALGGLACCVRGRISPVCWAILPVAGTFGIVLVDLLTQDTSAGAQVFFLWPVLYAAYLLARRAAVLVLAAVTGGEILVVTAGGVTSHSVTDAAALLTTLTVMALVVATLRERVDRLVANLADQAMRDPLTRLRNRRAFDLSIHEMVDAARAGDGRLSLLSIDLDNLKEINDGLGHSAGDAALRRVADALRGAVRAEDAVFRLGGDEFAALLPGCSPPDAHDRAAQLRERLRTADARAPVTVSVGIACWPGRARSVDQLLAEADRALYAAKRNGRDRVSTSAVPGRVMS